MTTFTVTTPDNVATARLESGSSVTVQLLPASFGAATPRHLADRLAILGELLCRDRDQVARGGRSSDGSVRVHTIGGQAWSVELEPAAYTRGEAAFCAAAGEAIAAALGGRG